MSDKDIIIDHLAGSMAEHQNEMIELEEELEILRSANYDLQEENDNLLQEIENLKAEVKDLQDEINEQNYEIDNLRELISDLEAQIDETGIIPNNIIDEMKLNIIQSLFVLPIHKLEAIEKLIK